MLCLGALAFAQGGGEKAELEKQLEKVAAAKSARQDVFMKMEAVAPLVKAQAETKAALEKLLAEKPEYAKLNEARAAAKKAAKLAKKSGADDAARSAAEKALDDADAAVDQYLAEHADLAAALNAAEDAEEAADDALDKAKDADAEYTALRQKEDELERSLEDLEARSGAAE